MIQFQVDEKRSDLLVAVQKLAKIAGDGKIKLHQVTVVTTSDADLIDILGALLVPAEIEEIKELEQQLWPAPIKEPAVTRHPGVEISKNGGKTVVTKRPQLKGSRTRKCAICGEEFEPSRRSQKMCTKTDCRRAVQKKYNQRYLSKKKIRSVVPEMEVPADPGPLANAYPIGRE